MLRSENRFILGRQLQGEDRGGCLRSSASSHLTFLLQASVSHRKAIDLSKLEQCTVQDIYGFVNEQMKENEKTKKKQEGEDIKIPDELVRPSVHDDNGLTSARAKEILRMYQVELEEDDDDDDAGLFTGSAAEGGGGSGEAINNALATATATSQVRRMRSRVKRLLGHFS